MNASTCATVGKRHAVGSGAISFFMMSRTKESSSALSVVTAPTER